MAEDSSCLAAPLRRRSLVARAASHPLVVRVGALTGGAAAAQALVVVATPFLARLYTAEDFGVFGVFASVLSIAACLGTLQYENAIPLPRSPRAAANLLAVSLATLVGMMALFASAIALLSLVAGRLEAVRILRPLLWFLPLAFLFTGLYLALLGWALRIGNFRAMVQGRVLQASTVAAAQIGLGMAGASAAMLALGHTLGWAAGAAILGRAAWRSGRAAFSGVSLAGMSYVARRYRKFPLVSSFSALLEVTQIQAPVLLVTALYGAEVGGLFLLANRMTLLPINMLALSVMQVMINHSTGEARSREMLARLLPRVLGGLLVVGTAIATVIAAAGPFVFAVVFGHEWIRAGVFVQALAPLLLAQFLVIPLNSILVTRERQGLLMIGHGLRVLLLFATLWWCATAGITPERMALIYALSQSVAYLATLGVIWRVGRAGVGSV